jgi:Skp family chaperone for outer membrane proteins
MKAFVLIVASFLAVSVYGQTQNIGKIPPEATADIKAPQKVFLTAIVATVDLRQAIVSTAEGQQASKDLQVQFAAVINELQELNKKVNDTKARLADPKTAEADKAGLNQDLAHLTQTLDNKNKHVEEDIKAAQTDVVVKIGKGLVEIIDSYAKTNGYIAVLDSSAQTSQLLFVSPSIDITKEVVRLYDQAHPVKTPAAAPASK